MRFVIFGAGAIGGVVGARLSQAGYDVCLIARGEHYRAIAQRGLRLEEPDGASVHAVEVVDGPDGVAWTGEDLVLLATKSQDSHDALIALRTAAGPDVPVCCLQNGVENERIALRLFTDVYAAVVMAPTAHLEPGIVQAYGANLTGMIDAGRYPTGVDDRVEALCAALRAARFDSRARADVMRFKYAKLIANLANAVHAITGGDSPESRQLIDRVRSEGREVLDAAGIEFSAPEVDDIRGRWKRFGVREIAGRSRAGSSTWQSLARGTRRVETDYLNGEIVMLGRMHGVETPVNRLLQDLAWEGARTGQAPGWLSVQELLGQLESREVSWTR
jgi:2-dehydropantoate 2-reductase